MEHEYDDHADTTTLRLQSYIERVSAVQGFDKMKAQIIPVDEEITSDQQPTSNADKDFMKNKPASKQRDPNNYAACLVAPT